MKIISRIEQSLAAAIAMGEDATCPPKLAGAIRHAVFPGGARIRPQLCLAVAQACGDDDPLLSDATAVASKGPNIQGMGVCSQRHSRAAAGSPVSGSTWRGAYSACRRPWKAAC